MKLITAAIQKKLDKNFENDNHDDIVLKLFGGSCFTWLITQIEPDGDIMHGLADLGMGFVEYGTISFNELKAARFQFGLGVERDMYFRGGKVKDFQDRTSLTGC